MPGLMPHPRKLAEMGRGGDTEVGHLTEGEVVVPPELAGNSDVRQHLLEAFERAGIDIGRYTVGGEDDSRNPRTGMREYRGRGAENEGDDRGFGGGGPGSGGGGGGGGEGGFGSGGDHHNAGAVSSSPAASAAGPGPGGGGERGREGGMYGGGGNQSGAPAAGETGGEAVTSPAGVTRNEVPSRATPGGGYHGPGGAIESGYTLTGPDHTGYEPGTLGFWESQNPIQAFLSRGLAGLFPFMGTAYSMLDRDAPLRTPSPPEETEGGGGGGGGSPSPPTATAATGPAGAATDATAAGAAGARQYGYFTPPADPSIPSWQRYLDVSS